jgi:hypothetical protein
VKIITSTLGALVLSTAAIVQSAEVLAGESDAPDRIQVHTAREGDAPIWYLRLPASGKVAFHGAVNFDNAGVGASGVPYPAPNAVGPLVAIAVHGAAVESSKNSQRKTITEAADKILAPYQTVLDSYEYVELMREGAGRMAAAGSKRTVIRTLRGGLMIVPAEQEDSANTAVEDCRREPFPVVMR